MSPDILNSDLTLLGCLSNQTDGPARLQHFDCAAGSMQPYTQHMRDDSVPYGLQQQVAAFQATRGPQLAHNATKAAEEAAFCSRAAQSTQGLIRLNVGGVEYTTSLATLTAVPESYFSALFGGNWEQVKTPDGAVFLDRDGEVFKYVLQYLRARKDSKEAMEYSLPASLSADTAAAVAEEATFLGLPELLATSWCRVEELQPLEYVYNFKIRQKYDLESKGIPSGWELVSANSIAGDKDYMLVICRHPDGPVPVFNRGQRLAAAKLAIGALNWRSQPMP